MCEASALMILREHKYLRFACESTKCRSVQNAITVAFETGAERVFLFGHCAIAGTKRTCCKWSEQVVFAGFTFVTVDNVRTACASP